MRPRAKQYLAPPCSDTASREIATSLHQLFGGIDLDPSGGHLVSLVIGIAGHGVGGHGAAALPLCTRLTCCARCCAADRLLGMYLVAEEQHRWRQRQALQALEAAGKAPSTAVYCITALPGSRHEWGSSAGPPNVAS